MLIFIFKERKKRMKIEQFPSEFLRKSEKYKRVSSEYLDTIKQILLAHPYRVYCLIEEVPTKEPTLFLLLYTKEMDNTVVLFDVSHQVNSTIATDLDVIAQGFFEILDVGNIKRYPLSFYLKE